MPPPCKGAALPLLEESRGIAVLFATPASLRCPFLLHPPAPQSNGGSRPSGGMEAPELSC